MPIKTPNHILHPGEVLAEIYMKDRGLNQSTLAKNLGCQARKINEIVNGKRAITPEFALQLAEFFNTTPEMWVRMQAEYDLIVIKKKMEIAGSFIKSTKKKTANKKPKSASQSPAPTKLVAMGR